MRKDTLDMTAGSPMRLLVRFTVPALVGNLLHQVYSITDSIIVGRYLGAVSLAAVGCTTPIVMLLAALMVGVNVGVSILISQYFGQKDFKKIRSTFINSLYLGLCLAAIMAVVGLLLARPILRWMGTPDEPLQDAAAYLRINFISSIFPLVYYLFSSVFRGLGDSKTSLYCLIVSVLANVGLDILFIAGFHWGVAGAAWATALAQGLSALFSAFMLWKRYPHMRLHKEDFAFHFPTFRRVAGLAMPIALQSAFNNLGNIVAQSAVNGFGASAMAAYTAAGRIGTLALMPVETIGSSLAVYTGQNHGADKPERIRSGVKSALFIAFVCSTLLGGALIFSGKFLTTLFLPEPTAEILSIVSSFLWITAVPGFLAGVMFIYQHVLRGMGQPGVAMAGGLMQLFAKIAIIGAAAWGLHQLQLVWFAWPVSFLAGTVVPYFYYRAYNKNQTQ